MFTKTRQRSWDIRCAALVEVTIKHRFAAAQKVKAQEFERKRCGVRDTSRVERRNFCSAAQWAANCAVEDAPFYYFSMRGARAEGEYRSVWIRAPPFYCHDSLGGTSVQREVRAAAFSLRRSKLVCK